MDYWISSLILLVISYIVFKAIEKRNYFKKWRVPQPPELPFLGIMGKHIFVGRHISDPMKVIYNVNKKAKYIGCHMFLTPVIVVRDLDLIKNILVKSFDHFAYHKSYVDETMDPLFGGNLFFLNGNKWRDVRNKLSPTFTSSKMRSMYELMSHCTENFVDQFIELHCGDKIVDLKDALSRYANDVIATCAFGIEIDSLKNPKNEFYVRGRKATQVSIMMIVKLFFVIAFPSLTRMIGVRFLSGKDSDYFVNVIETTIKTRKEKGIVRPDMLQLMIDAKENGNDLDMMTITAQAFVFFFAGFDTTSSHMCMMAHELALNLDAQKKLQTEIDDIMKKSNGKPTYEDINNMPYLEAVFNECLRIHSIGYLTRVCSEDFELPPALPGSKPYMVKKGMEMMIPISGIHTDPDYYENPEKFDPGRFLSKKVTTGDVTSLGFGMGPRACIGFRFALLETKTLLVHLLHKCSFEPCEKTRLPIKYARHVSSPTAEGGSWFKITPRK